MRALLAFLMALSLSWSTTATAHVERLKLHVSETLTLPTRAKGYDAKESSHPSTGRFLSLDPVAGSLSDPLSTQGYTYAHANPTRYTDPDGRVVQLPVCMAIGTAVGAAAGALTALHNGTSVGNAVGLGAVSGFLNGATCGASLLTQVFVGAAVGGVTGTIGALETAETADQVWEAGRISAFAGGAMGVVGYGASAGTEFAKKYVTSTISRIGLNYAVDGGISAASQLALNGGIDPVQVGIDALAGAGARFGHAKWGQATAKRRSLSAAAAGPSEDALIAIEMDRLIRELHTNAEDHSDDFLYRGVAPDHPGFADAVLRAEAVPDLVDHNLMKLDFFSDEIAALAKLHSRAKWDKLPQSPFLSWTRDPMTAMKFAGPNGVVLKVPRVRAPEGASWRIFSPDNPYILREQEVLQQGVRKDVEVIPAVIMRQRLFRPRGR